MWLIFSPVPLINLTVYLFERSVAIALISHKLSLIDISIRISYLSIALQQTLLPKALIKASILICLSTFAMLDPYLLSIFSHDLHLTLVDRAILRIGVDF